MAGKSVYDVIKKQNGEQFARVLRANNVLEIPGVDKIVQFAGNTAQDAKNILSYLWSLKPFDEVATDARNLGPVELLHRAGYEFVEYADTLEKQNAIQKYFRPDERLCTFNDPNRYKECYIINAVKHNAKNIKRAHIPKRQDEYGTSVISIQIDKECGYISIKNRYNHAVDNPDNTFDSNPDNIILGLSTAIKTYFNIDWKINSGCLPYGYVIISDRVYKYNYQINSWYFGNDWYERSGNVVHLNKDSQVMLDCFIWDNHTKELINPLGRNDGFVTAFRSEIKDKNITITGGHGDYVICADGVPIVRSVNGVITELNMPNIKKLDCYFLYHNKKLRKINIPNVEDIDDCCLVYNTELTDAKFPRVKSVGYNFLMNNQKMNCIDLPNVRLIRGSFLYKNNKIREISLPRVRYIGEAFMAYNTVLEKIDVPMVRHIRPRFLIKNNSLRVFDAPLVEKIGHDSLYCNNALQQINMPLLKEAEEGVLAHALNAKKFEKMLQSGNGVVWSKVDILAQIRKIFDNRMQMPNNKTK